MPSLYITPLRHSGTHCWCHAESESLAVLEKVAHFVGRCVNEDSRGMHVDLSERDREMVIRKVRGIEVLVDEYLNPPTLN